MKKSILRSIIKEELLKEFGGITFDSHDGFQYAYVPNGDTYIEITPESKKLLINFFPKPELVNKGYAVTGKQYFLPGGYKKFKKLI